MNLIYLQQVLGETSQMLCAYSFFKKLRDYWVDHLMFCCVHLMEMIQLLFFFHIFSHFKTCFVFFYYGKLTRNFMLLAPSALCCFRLCMCASVCLFECVHIQLVTLKPVPWRVRGLEVVVLPPDQFNSYCVNSFLRCLVRPTPFMYISAHVIYLLLE